MSNSSKYFGVALTSSGKWQVIQGGTQIGLFDNEEEAARAYDDSLRAFYPDKPRIFNFPKEGDKVKYRGVIMVGNQYRVSIAVKDESLAKYMASVMRRSAIYRNKKQIFVLVNRDTAIEAAQVYNTLAVMRDGDKAKLNSL